MKTSLSALVIIAALWCVIDTSEVMESNSPYSCCGNAGIKFDPRCETTWNINDKPFARSTGECISPCKEIKEGLMMLDLCIDINATTVCTNEKDVIQETRTHHPGQPCSSSASNYAGSQGLDGLLLLLLIGGFFVLK